MNVRAALHQLVEELTTAWDWRTRLQELDAEALTSLDLALADLAAGRVKPLAEYERERSL